MCYKFFLLFCFSVFESSFFDLLRSHCLSAGEKDFVFNLFVYIVNMTDYQLMNADWEPRVGIQPKNLITCMQCTNSYSVRENMV